MKILEMGLARSSVAAITADKHVVISCAVSDSEDLFEYIDCEAPQVIVADIDTHSWLLSEIRALRHLEVRVPVVALVSPNCIAHRERRTEFLESGGNDLLEKPERGGILSGLELGFRLIQQGGGGGFLILHFRGRGSWFGFLFPKWPRQSGGGEDVEEQRGASQQHEAGGKISHDMKVKGGWKWRQAIRRR